MNPKQVKQLLAITAVAITAYTLGCLTHSEIIHFFLNLFT